MKALVITCIISFLLLSAFTAKKKNKQKLPDEFVYIPGGTYSDGNPDEPFDVKKRKTLIGFYISKYEVSNLQYRRFFAEVAPGLTTEKKEIIMSDSSAWARGPLIYGEPLRTYYHMHPAYNNHPVVNIRYEGALKYCEWLQQKIQKDNPDFLVSVQLPAKEQWTWAARGGRSHAMYPWSGYYLRNKKGEYLCNFKKIGDHAITKNKETGLPQISVSSHSYLVQSPVKSFYPNDWGLYNMSGNAAEMIAEKGICMGGSWDDYGGDVTTTSEAGYDTCAPTIGFRPIIIISEKKK